MVEVKLNKARQPQEKRATGLVEANKRLKQEPARRQRADRLKDAELDIAPGIITILDALPFYVMLIDESHHILLANKAVRDQLQVSPEEILGQYCPQAIHGLKGPFPGCPLEEAVAAGKGAERELYDKRNGRWVNSAVYPTGLKTQGGKDVFYHMTFDITDRKKAEERHKESEQRFQSHLQQRQRRHRSVRYQKPEVLYRQQDDEPDAGLQPGRDKKARCYGHPPPERPALCP